MRKQNLNLLLAKLETAISHQRGAMAAFVELKKVLQPKGVPVSEPEIIGITPSQINLGFEDVLEVIEAGAEVVAEVIGD